MLPKRYPDRADVAEVDVDGADAVLRAEELDARRPVDEVEEDELPVLATGGDTPGEATAYARLGAGLETVRLVTNGSGFVPVGKPLRKSHGGRESTLRPC